MKALTTIIFLLCAATSVLQAQVTASVSLRRPTPASLSEWQRDPGIVQVILANSGASALRNVRIAITIRDLDEDRIVARTDNDHPAMPRFTIPPLIGGALVLTGPELINQNAIDVDDRLRTVAITTNALPEGTYEFCITVLAEDGTDLTSTGPACTIFDVFIPDPPVLIRPVDEFDLESSAGPQFFWTTVTGLPPSTIVQYQLTIAPVFAGQSGRDAIDRNPPLLTTTTPATSYMYLPSDLPFSTYPEAARFAWQIQALDAEGRPATRNEGKSEVGLFGFGGAGDAEFGALQLQPYWPAQGDTLPWTPPHLIVRFTPYSDSLNRMEYTLTLRGDDGSTHTNSRTLRWPRGPMESQGAPSPERAQLIIVNIADAGGFPSWASSLRRGVRYSWEVEATFGRVGARDTTVRSPVSDFVMGLRTPSLIAPADGAAFPIGAEVALRWTAPRPDSLNFWPPDVLTRRSSDDRMAFGSAVERMKLEVARTPDFGAPLFAESILELPASGAGYVTGDDCAEFFNAKMHDLGALSDTGVYYWRVAYLRAGADAYSQGPTWNFRIGSGISASECLRITPRMPALAGRWTRDNRPQFSVDITPPINLDALRGGRLQIWRMTSDDEDSATASARPPVFDQRAGSGIEALRAAGPGGVASAPFDIMLLNREGAPHTFTSENGASYLWRFTLEFDGARIRSDSIVCPLSSVAGAFGTFRADSTAESTPSECRDICSTPPPDDTTPATRTFAVGDTLRIGRFGLELTRVSGAGGALSGEGLIQVGFLNARVAVEFSSIRVNNAGEVYDGTVGAMQAEDSPLSEEDANRLGELIGMSNEEIENLHGFASQSARLVSGLTGLTPLRLPIGLDKTIEGERMVIGVIGMVFRPTDARLNAVASFPLPELGPGIGLGLGARDICFHPNGIGGDGRGQLYLAADIGYRRDESWSFAFKAPNESDSGTYVSWDCRGFKELRLKAEVEFPRSWFVPVPDLDSNKAKAEFVASVQRMGNWMASASMERFTPADMPGFEIEVLDLTIDQSALRNPEGMVFPFGYRGATNDRWKGFYIRRAGITLPEEMRTFDSTRPVRISVNHLMIDNNGFSADIRVENVIQYPRGNFGEWGVSIDTLGANFVNSSLSGGRLIGRFQIPISDSAIDYRAVIARAPGTDSVRYEFLIQPRDTINGSIWAVDISLNPTSRIELSNMSGSFVAQATLSGAIMLEGDRGGIPGLSFNGVRFENFRLMTNDPYIDRGTWSFASPQHGVAGFPVSINDIGIVTGSRSGSPGVGIQFTLEINLQPGSAAISGGTQLSIWGRLGRSSSGGQRFEFDGVDLDSIGVAADLGAVEIRGSVVFYRDDPTFGKGFRGEVWANFLDQVEVTAAVQFGKVRDFRYWYVDAKAVIATGIPIFSGFAIYGFGGGAWYRMRREGADPPPPSTDAESTASSPPGTTVSGYRYVPDEEYGLGLRAMIILGTHPKPDAFNADVAIEAEFLSGGGLGRISIIGAGYLLAGLSNREDAKVTANVDLTYDFPARTFHGVFDVRVNADPLTGGGTMVIHVDPETWYIKIGEPSSRVNLSLADWLRIDAYLMVGMDLPSPPPLPAEVSSVLGPMPMTRNPALARGDGFAFGASARFGTGRKRFLIFYGEIEAGVGFDIALLNFGDGTRCEGRTGDLGVNGWYAMGQLYAYIYASIGLHVDVWFTSGDFEILSLHVAAALQAGAPNPTWLKGAVGGRYRILGGLIKGSCRFEFKMGEECIPEVESPLARIDLISDIQPQDGARDVDVFIEPQAAFNFAINQPFEIREMASDGRAGRIRTFRIQAADFTLTETDAAAPVDGTWAVGYDDVSATFTSNDVLKANTRHTAAIRAFGEEYIGESWEPAVRLDGRPIGQAVRATWTTGAAPDNIPEHNVLYAYPFRRQRYFLQDECRNGILQLRNGQPELFMPREGYRMRILARFIPVHGGAERTATARYNSSARTVTFTIPSLTNETIYALQIVRSDVPDRPPAPFGGRISRDVYTRPELTSMRLHNVFRRDTVTLQLNERALPGERVRNGEKLLYVYYFRTSRYNRLQSKILALDARPADHEGFGNLELLRASYTAPERFDRYDVSGTSYYRTGLLHRVAPLVRPLAAQRTNRWHTRFTNPWVYDAIARMRSTGMWAGQVEFERYLRIPSLQLANFYTAGIGLLTDAEIQPRPTGGSSSGGPFSRYGGIGSALGGMPGVPAPTASFEALTKIRYKHGIVVPFDFTRVQRRAAWLLSVYGGEFMPPSEERWLRSIIAKRYVRMYRGTYTLGFSYGYYGCRDPDSSVPVYYKPFTY